VKRIRAALLACALAACGPAPSAPVAPTGTLVVVVRQGAERVPFHPQLARIQQANEQLAARLGHSIRIELDGALLPQTREGAEDLIARLVESAARDVDAVGKRDPKALAFAREGFETLVVRYSPADAAARSSRAAQLDATRKTIDVVRAEATWTALEPGELAGVLYDAWRASETAELAHASPEALPPSARRAWFEFHAHSNSAPGDRISGLDVFRARAMVTLHGLAVRDGDAALAKDVRAWLVAAAEDFASAYMHEPQKIAASQRFRDAERAYMGWLRAELPRMSVDERGVLAKQLWLVDFRTPSSAPDRFAKDVFPGVDRMQFALAAMDAWIADGHPSTFGTVKPLYVAIVCPTYTEVSHGRTFVQDAGRCDDMFARWALADPAREATFASAVLARGDVPLARATLRVAHRVLREEPRFLAFLRSFEGSVALWQGGADLVRESVFRPSPALLEESRRLWAAPSAEPRERGWALFWFARQAEGSYEPDDTWAELLDGQLADERLLTAYLAGGWEAFELLPVTWRALQRGGRARAIIAAARPLLDAKIAVRPGGRSVTGTLEAVARLLCEEHAMGELAELRSFAEAELAARPGAGLSEVVAATAPSACTPKPRPPLRPKHGKKKPGDKPSDPTLFPPKAPLPPGER
jgi:hypothetical protein